MFLNEIFSGLDCVLPHVLAVFSEGACGWDLECIICERNVKALALVLDQGQRDTNLREIVVTVPFIPNC